MHVYEFPEQDTLDKLRNLPDREQGDIEWPNVIANVSTKSHEKHIIESSFSLFTNINGTSRIRSGNKELSICEQTLFLGNPFESFHYHIDSTSRIETLNVHLNHGTYTRVMYALTQSHETLLDRPTGTQTEYRFSDQLHYKDQRMAQLLSSFQTGTDEGFFMALIQYCLVLDQREKGRSLMVAATKKSTRDELGKRMARARDHLYGRYMDTTLSVTDVAGEVGLGLPDVREMIDVEEFLLPQENPLDYLPVGSGGDFRVFQEFDGGHGFSFTRGCHRGMKARRHAGNDFKSARAFRPGRVD